MTDIIQELRGLIAGGVPESDSGWYISNTTGSGLSIIEDGLMFPGSGIFPIKCEPPQAALIVAAINHLPALLDRLEAAEWRPIERKPEAPVNAVLWFPNMQFHDQHGDPFIFGGLRDILERYYLAFWDGEIWVESGTGHDVFEDWKSPDDLPTHWRPLPDAPAIREVKP